MALKFSSAFQEALMRGVKILVYGRSGMGKTMLAATLPEPEKWVILAVEPGLLALAPKNQLRVFPDRDPVDIPVWVVTTLAELIEAYELLLRPDCPYIGVFMDSVSEIGEKVLANALAQVKDPRQAYGELMEKMTDVLKKFRDLEGKHVVFVAKECSNKDGSIPLHVPMLPGNKVGPSIPYLVDEVFHIDIGTLPDGTTKYRYLQTQPDINFDAKDRSGALDPIEEPNLSKLINKIVS